MLVACFVAALILAFLAGYASVRHGSLMLTSILTLLAFLSIVIKVYEATQ